MTKKLLLRIAATVGAFVLVGGISVAALARSGAGSTTQSPLTVVSTPEVENDATETPDAQETESPEAQDTETPEADDQGEDGDNQGEDGDDQGEDGDNQGENEDCQVSSNDAQGDDNDSQDDCGGDD